MSGLPQLENFFWPQCGFEADIGDSRCLDQKTRCLDQKTPNQLRHPGTKE